MDNKKIPTILGIIVIIIIAVTVGVMVWRYEKIQNQDDAEMQSKVVEFVKPVENKQKESENKEGQFIYRNLKYKYSIEIPEGFKSKSGAEDDSLIRINKTREQGSALFSVFVENSEIKKIDEWIKEYKQKLSKMTSYEGVEVVPPSIISTKKMLIDSVEAKGITIKNMPYSNYSIVFIKNNFVYEISYNGLLNKGEDELLKKESDKKDVLLSEFQSKHILELENIAKNFKFIQ